jgi:RNA polymerase sigma factor (sigma-70 family)
MFIERFQDLIFIYLLRSLRYHSRRQDVNDLILDLTQEVYIRLVQHGGHMLRSFRGSSDFSAKAFLARVCASVVSDHLRYHSAGKRSSDNVVSIEETKEMIESTRHAGDELDIAAILSWIDIGRIVAADPERRNAQRNALIFKLHYIDGLDETEIAAYPGFDLTPAGVTSVLARLRRRIRK